LIIIILTQLLNYLTIAFVFSFSRAHIQDTQDTPQEKIVYNKYSVIMYKKYDYMILIVELQLQRSTVELPFTKDSRTL